MFLKKCEILTESPISLQLLVNVTDPVDPVS